MIDDDLPLEPWAVGMRPDHAEFVREFLIDLNAYRALKRLGKSDVNARTNAHRVLRRPDIVRAVAQAMQERSEALGITAKTILGEAFRCYLAAAADKNWTAAGRFLEMCGRHVDVRAFRDRFAPGMGDDEPDDDATSLSDRMSLEELEQLARLSRKAAGEPEDGPPPSSLRH